MTVNSGGSDLILLVYQGNSSPSAPPAILIGINEIMEAKAERPLTQAESHLSSHE
jgi:hypothetical protein